MQHGRAHLGSTAHPVAVLSAPRCQFRIMSRSALSLRVSGLRYRVNSRPSAARISLSWQRPLRCKRRSANRAACPKWVNRMSTLNSPNLLLFAAYNMVSEADDRSGACSRCIVHQTCIYFQRSCFHRGTSSVYEEVLERKFVRTKVLPLRLQRDGLLAAEARGAPHLIHPRRHACADARAHTAARHAS